MITGTNGGVQGENTLCDQGRDHQKDKKSNKHTHPWVHPQAVE